MYIMLLYQQIADEYIYLYTIYTM